MKVAFLGPKGTYTHQATDQYFDSYEAVPCSSLRETVEAEADAAVIPFENSLGGGVSEAVDILREHDIEVTGEIKVDINHVLASEQALENVGTVVSHPQALTQSKQFINKEDLDKAESSSTAKAAENLEKGQATICSRKAAEINGLDIITDKVQDRETNTTRFLVLNGDKSEGDKTSLILQPGEDRPGLLEAMLSCFSGHGINLEYIQSRPTRNGLGKYYFYVEADAGKNSENFSKVERCLQTYADVKVLGSYKRG